MLTHDVGFERMNLSRTIQIERPKRIEKIINAVCNGIPTGEFELISGDLQWSDFVDCRIKHNPTGKTWWLHYETYHGSGGAWEPSEE